MKIGEMIRVAAGMMVLAVPAGWPVLAAEVVLAALGLAGSGGPQSPDAIHYTLNEPGQVSAGVYDA
jgi:hypothetical protein